MKSSDMLNPDSWTKIPDPVFQTNSEISRYGPGHNSFTVSEDGMENLFVFHARDYKEIIGDPLYDPNRHTYIQKLTWNSEE